MPPKRGLQLFGYHCVKIKCKTANPLVLKKKILHSPYRLMGKMVKKNKTKPRAANNQKLIIAVRAANIYTGVNLI